MLLRATLHDTRPSIRKEKRRAIEKAQKWAHDFLDLVPSELLLLLIQQRACKGRPLPDVNEVHLRQLAIRHGIPARRSRHECHGVVAGSGLSTRIPSKKPKRVSRRMEDPESMTRLMIACNGYWQIGSIVYAPDRMRKPLN
jgi:hypothetical protein